MRRRLLRRVCGIEGISPLSDVIALDAMSEENAGIGVVPGSHAIGDEEAAATSRITPVRFILTLLVFLSLMLVRYFPFRS